MAFDTIMVFEGQFKDHILPDQIHALSVSFLVPSMRKEFGGCAGNISYNLKLLGGNPTPVATVGMDAQGYLQRLKSLDIRTNGISVVQDHFTAQCFITTDLKDNQLTAFHPGAMAVAADNDLSALPGEWAIVAPDAKEAMFAHARRLKARGTPFIFDLGQAMPLFDRDDLCEMIEMTDVLTVNDYEAHIVKQRTGISMSDLSFEKQAVIVTLADQGSVLWQNGVATNIAPVKAEQVVDPTGCGDAYRAGLLYGVSNGWMWEKSCQLASLMGSIKVGYRGPQNHAPSREDIAERLYKAYGIDF